MFDRYVVGVQSYLLRFGVWKPRVPLFLDKRSPRGRDFGDAQRLHGVIASPKRGDVLDRKPT